MFIYMPAGVAAYILSALHYFLYLSTFFVLTFFERVSGDSIAPTLTSLPTAVLFHQ